MPRVVGVAFRRAARSYWFDPGDLDLKVHDRVTVMTARGLELGVVRTAPRDVAEADLPAPLKRVLRLATEEDARQEERNRRMAADALATCHRSVTRLGLPMKPLSAELMFDGSQVTICFSAEGRIDFRELVKDLAAQLRCRVLLHQVGSRDEARMLGGCGPCGRSYCCASFLSDFAPVSMKMAKDQCLFLNPAKFSGACGKLMCCLRFEHDTYLEARSRVPAVGDTVDTPAGVGRVTNNDMVRECVTVVAGEPQTQHIFPASEVAVRAPETCPGCGSGNGAPGRCEAEWPADTDIPPA